MADQSNEEGVTLPIATKVGQTLSPEDTAAQAVTPDNTAVVPIPKGDDGLYHAQLNGHPVTFDTQPTFADLHHLDKAMQPQPESAFMQQNDALAKRFNLAPADPDNQVGDANTAFGNAFNRTGALLNLGVKEIGNRLDQAGDYLGLPRIGPKNESNADALKDYDKALQDNPLLNETAGEKLATTAGELIPGVGAFALGGVPALAAAGGAMGVGQGDKATGGSLGGEALGGATGTLTSTMPVPFIRGTSPNLLYRAAKAGLGGFLTGGAANIAQQESNDILTKGSLEAPDLAQASSAGVTMAPFGALAGAEGAMGAKDALPDRTVPVDTTQTGVDKPEPGGAMTPQQRADSALQDRIVAKAGNTPVTARNSQSILDPIDGEINSELNAVKASVADSLDPKLATDIQDTIDRGNANGILKNGLTKVKATVTEDDINNLLSRPVGDTTLGKTQQGSVLADLLRQKNSLTKLMQGTQLGGLASLTAQVDPFAGLLPGGSGGGREGPGPAGRELALKMAGLSAAPVTLGADIAARGVGKLGDVTGLWAGNSKLNNFMRANAGATPPIAMGGLRDIQAENYAAQQMAPIQANAAQVQKDAMRSQAAYDGYMAQQQAAQQSDAMASQKTWDMNQAQLQAAQAKQDGQQQSDAMASQKAWDAYTASQQADAAQGLDQQTRDARASQKAWDAYDNQRLSDARASQKSYETMANSNAKQTQTDAIRSQRAYEGWLGTQRQATARFNQTQADAEELDQAQKLRAARLVHNDPGSSGFDRYIYNESGLKPQEAMDAVTKLRDQGVVSQAHHSMFIGNPKALMKNNVGNMIADLLRIGADKGEFAGRDPEWQPGANISPLQTAIHNPIAYAAAAKGNQDRVTAASGRLESHLELSPTAKTALAGAANTIGRMKSKAEAADVMVKALNNENLSPTEKAIGEHELSPLVSQIKHDMPKDQAVDTIKEPEVQQAIKKAATEMTNGNNGSLAADEQEAVRRFTQKGLLARMSKSDAHLYGLQMADAWVKAGKSNLDAWLP